MVEPETENAVRINGVVVDAIEVLEINSVKIEPSPQYGVDVDQIFLTGMGKAIMLLNADKILNADVFQKLETV